MKPRILGPALLLAALLALAFAGIATVGFSGTLEARRALIAGNMLSSGDWIVPRELDEPKATKPPLVYWLMAAASVPVGEVTVATARIPSAVAAVGSCLLLGALGLAAGDRRLALLAPLVLMTTALFRSQAQYAELDMVMTFFATAAGVAYWRAVQTRRGVWAYVMWACLGLSLLAKGPLGVAAVLGGVACHLAAAHDAGLARSLRWFTGPLVMLGFCAPWVILAWSRIPDMGATLWSEVAGRVGVSGPASVQHRESPLYYIVELDKFYFPWVFVGVLAILGAFAAPNGRAALRRVSEGPGGFMLGWWLTAMVILAAISNRRFYYATITVPPFAYLCASMLAGIDEPLRSAFARLRQSGPVGAGLVVGGLATAFVGGAGDGGRARPWLGGHFPPLPVLLLVAGLSVASLGTAMVLARRAGMSMALPVGLAAAACAGLFLYSLRFAPEVERATSQAAFMERAMAASEGGSRLALYGDLHHAVLFYARRRIPFLRDRAALERAHREHPETLFISPRDEFRKLGRSLAAPLDEMPQAQDQKARLVLFRYEGEGVPR